MDLREFLFLPLAEQRFNFTVSARERGLFAGSEFLRRAAAELRVNVEWIAPDGFPLQSGTPVLVGSGDAGQVTGAEETLLGGIGKPSGVATAAADFVRTAQGRARIVCGAWKKVSPAVRADLRQAIAVGGAGIRIADEAFIYLDKNCVRMFGGVGPAIRRAKEFDPERLVVVQLRGEREPVGREARTAVAAGAGILMVDTGDLADIKDAVDEIRRGGRRDKARLAFAGGVVLARVPAAIAAGADIIDVGRAVIDAPMLDFRFDVEEV
ncbi:MAG: nicotinate-nucleotide pyrophosphorylase [Peptococcaceae bacterium]|nr:nicotinate-nucleotide pyrophosphorylase [Peptococcaceae bacterium]